METVVEGETGIFFHRSDVSSLIAAIADFEHRHIDWSAACRKRAEVFSLSQFQKQMREFVTQHRPIQ